MSGERYALYYKNTELCIVAWGRKQINKQTKIQKTQIQIVSVVDEFQIR